MVDTSIWINFFNGNLTPKVEKFIYLLKNEPICICDIILLEILQGIKDDNQYLYIKELLQNFIIFNVLNIHLAIKTAENYRFLRKKGITIRKSIDTLIATFCIENDIQLLQSDKDFEPFEKHLNLQLI